ncbi:MAG: hypothetical protein WBL39_02880 [Terrimicrobiaceae bacterium]
MHLIRILAFESCEVDRRHTEKVVRPVVQTIDLKLRLLRRVTGQRRIASTQALDAYVKPVENNVGDGIWPVFGIDDLVRAPSPVPVAGAKMLFEKVDIWSVNHSRLLHLFTQI